MKKELRIRDEYGGPLNFFGVLGTPTSNFLLHSKERIFEIFRNWEFYVRQFFENFPEISQNFFNFVKVERNY